MNLFSFKTIFVIAFAAMVIALNFCWLFFYGAT